jgi:DNA mismatch repair protein MutS2
MSELHIYPPEVPSKLDFPFILERLEKACRGNLGVEEIKNQSFSTDVEWIRASLSQVSEFKQILETDNQFPEQGFHPLPFLSRASIAGAALSESEFVKVALFLKTFHDILHFFLQKKRAGQYPHLESLIKEVFWDKQLLNEIERIIDAEKEIVKESASPELGRIRRQMVETDREQQGAFARAVRHYRQKGYLAEQEESVRNGRPVLAVKAEHKRIVHGIYHDDSGNGTIAFIEPNETVQLNNELASLAREERREIERILRQLTEYIRPYIKHFHRYLQILAAYDAIRAKALVAIELKAEMPNISEDGKYQLFNFRHPLLYWSHRKSGKPVVENTLLLDVQEKVLLISGPNAGGKSIVLKSAGLIQLMFQFGMLVPVSQGTSLPVFKQLLVDIGDAQSVENDLSTYSSHLRNMKYFTDHAGKHSLILLDELGHGTDPSLGGAMAEAMMDHLLSKKVYAVVTTHYANLKAWGARTEGVQNAAMSFDRKHLEPLYHLQAGSPGSSFTFEIAAKSGLNPAIIQAAKEKIGEQNKEMELSLAEIQHEKQYIKGIRKNLQQREKQVESLQKTYEQLKKELDKEKKKLLKDVKEKALDDFNAANRELETLMRAWKEDKQDKAKFLEVRRYIDEQRSAIEKDEAEQELQEAGLSAELPEDGQIDVGSIVRLEDGVQTGEVVEMRRNAAVVAFGNTLTHVKLNRLQLAGKSKTVVHKVVLDTQQRMAARTAFDINLDIRGLAKEEALTALENFLDRAMMFGCNTVRIIHGRGTGVLRQTVQSFLKRYPKALKFAYEGHPGGGDGVTVVELG